MLKELTHYTFNVCQNANLINNKRRYKAQNNIKEFFREETESELEREGKMELQMGKNVKGIVRNININIYMRHKNFP